MATKDNYLSFKANHQNAFVDTTDNQYNNLNLNQNYRYSNNDNEYSKSFTTDSSRNNQNNDLTHFKNYLQSKKVSNSWNKSEKNKLSTNFLNIYDNFEKDKGFLKSKSANNSTLSLHIAAYENSNEAATNYTDECLPKKWGISNHFGVDSSTCVIQNPFEFPRQQQDEAGNRPELMQFSASQRLLNPNQVDTNNQIRQPQYISAMSDDAPAAFYGSHILGRNSLRIYDASMDDSYDKEVPAELVPGTWTNDAVQEHIKMLLNLLPRKLDCLVFVNDGLFKIEHTQAAISAVTKGTIVRVIPALMARFLYITHNIQPPINEDQNILILTKVSDVSDFHVLKRNNSEYIFHHEFLGWPANVPAVFEKYVGKFVAPPPSDSGNNAGGKAVIVYDQQNEAVKNEICEKFSHIDVIQTVCPPWDEMLLSGGLNKASTVISEAYKIAMDVKDFTIGCQLNVGSKTGNDGEKTVLIQVGTTIPVKLCKEMILEKLVKIRSNCTTVFKENAGTDPGQKNTHKRLMNQYFSKRLEKGMYLLSTEVEENGGEKIIITKVNSAASNEIKKPLQDEPAKVLLPTPKEVSSPQKSGEGIPKMPSKNTANVLSELFVQVADATDNTVSHDSHPSASNKSPPPLDPQPKRRASIEVQHLPNVEPPRHHEKSTSHNSKAPQRSRSPYFENSAQRRGYERSRDNDRERLPREKHRQFSRSRSPERPSSRPSLSPLIRRRSSTDDKPLISPTPPEVAEQKSLTLPNPADFMICLNGRHCCVCLPADGNTTTRITNINGNKWTPMYVSFLKVPPALGEVAKADLNVNPEGVLFDICKFISIPFKDLEINPEWAFNVAYTGRKIQQTVLEVQTWKGIHSVDPVSVLALVFVGLHKEAERVSGKSLKRVFVKKTKPVGKEESAAIKEAIRIARLECAGIETMPNIEVDE